MDGSVRASAATDSLLGALPAAMLTPPTPHSMPKHLRAICYSGNAFRLETLLPALEAAGGDLGNVEWLDACRLFRQTSNIVAVRGYVAEVPEVVRVLDGPPDVDGVRPHYRTTEEGHDPLVVRAASTLARDQPAEVDLRDEQYKHLSDYELAELFCTKKNPDKRSRLPPGSTLSGKHRQTPATYNRALLLRKLKEAGIKPDDAPPDEA